MKKNIVWMTLLVLASLLFARCTLPSVSSVAGGKGNTSFDSNNLTPEMLDGTMWGGDLTIRPHISPFRYMIILFKSGKVAIVRGKTKADTLRRLENQRLENYTIDQEKKLVLVSEVFDSHIGETRVEITYESNIQNTIRLFLNRSSKVVLYETKGDQLE